MDAFDTTRPDWRKGCYLARMRYSYNTFTEIIEQIYEDYSIYTNYDVIKLG